MIDCGDGCEMHVFYYADQTHRWNLDMAIMLSQAWGILQFDK